MSTTLDSLSGDLDLDDTIDSSSSSSEEVGFTPLIPSQLDDLQCFSLQSAKETVADSAARVTNNRVRLILSHSADGPILAKDLVEFLEVDPVGSRQYLEDSAFIRLHRGYTLGTAASWVITRIFCSVYVN